MDATASEPPSISFPRCSHYRPQAPVLPEGPPACQRSHWRIHANISGISGSMRRRCRAIRLAPPIELPTMGRVRSVWRIGKRSAIVQVLEPTGLWRMSDKVTNLLLLEHLTAIQSKLSSMANDIGNLKSDMRGLKSHMADSCSRRWRRTAPWPPCRRGWNGLNVASIYGIDRRRRGRPGRRTRCCSPIDTTPPRIAFRAACACPAAGA